MLSIYFFNPLLSSIVLARTVGLLLPAHPLTSQETEGYVYLVARAWRRTIDRGAQTLFGGQFNPVLVPVLVPALQWERT